MLRTSLALLGRRGSVGGRSGRSSDGGEGTGVPVVPVEVDVIVPSSGVGCGVSRACVGELVAGVKLDRPASNESC